MTSYGSHFSQPLAVCQIKQQQAEIKLLGGKENSCVVLLGQQRIQCSRWPFFSNEAASIWYPKRLPEKKKKKMSMIGRNMPCMMSPLKGQTLQYVHFSLIHKGNSCHTRNALIFIEIAWRRVVLRLSRVSWAAWQRQGGRKSSYRIIQFRVYRTEISGSIPKTFIYHWPLQHS